MRQLAYLSLLLLAASAVLGCPKELPPELPADELYRIGLEKFERRDWNGTIEAMQRFVMTDPGAARVDSAQLLTGEAYFNQKQYLTAAAEFLRLAQDRPAGRLADLARYRACESYYELSPRPELDQEFTEQAINECRAVVLLYPGSPYAESAVQRVLELTNRIARKYYLNGVYYYRRKAYDSAIVYLEYMLETYRGSEVEPEALLKLYEAYVKLGYTDEADRTRNRLLRDYPDSPEARELRGNSPVR
ncbi:MAG: outer membrane protein assembly factor BamD [Gemmatimonadota bacterium]|nr:MAG: outer membrane protein assembly factor BamD [Gemmatimonadota bacterium]